MTEDRCVVCERVVSDVPTYASLRYFRLYGGVYCGDCGPEALEALLKKVVRP